MRVSIQGTCVIFIVGGQCVLKLFPAVSSHSALSEVVVTVMIPVGVLAVRVCLSRGTCNSSSP